MTEGESNSQPSDYSDALSTAESLVKFLSIPTGHTSNTLASACSICLIVIFCLYMILFLKLFCMEVCNLVIKLKRKCSWFIPVHHHRLGANSWDVRETIFLFKTFGR